ncbi:MAG: class I SAM-dependent DNA methyltransferase [Phycisphaerae bacterium]
MSSASPPPPSQPAGATPEFDQFAGDYDAALNRGISLSGEGKDYFIERRIDWTARCLARLHVPGSNLVIMDYGAGTGSAFAKLRDTFKAARLIGVDVSTAELDIAKKDYPWSEVCTPDQAATAALDGVVDLAYSNGTFHHIPPDIRQSALALVHRSLKPGGLFALWENNPWNPGTRWVMSRIPFDKDAITLNALETKRRVRQAGFEVLRTDFLFIFPKMFAPLRALEPLVSRLPMGAQYQVLCRKPQAKDPHR